MTKYCYILKDSSDAKATITDIIKAPDIQSAFAMIMNTINSFNALQPEYAWRLDNIDIVDDAANNSDIFQLDKFNNNEDDDKCDCPDCNCEHCEEPDENEEYAEDPDKYDDGLPF